MNAALLGLKKNGTIPEPLYRRLRSLGGHISLLYGLPKIHKSLRPIVSIVSSPTYALSKHLESHYWSRISREAIYIRRQPSSLNRDRGTLSDMYDFIIL